MHFLVKLKLRLRSGFDMYISFGQTHLKTVVQNEVLYMAQLKCHHDDGTQQRLVGSIIIQDETTNQAINIC